MEQLFGSKTRVKLLRLFFSNPNRSFYVREITRKIEEQINSVRRELANLLSLGIITSDSNNNRLYYEVNQQYEYFVPLQQIFGSTTVFPIPTKESDTQPSTEESSSGTHNQQQDEEVVSSEAKQWISAGNIAAVAYSGVYTRDESAHVDIIIIGDVVISRIESLINNLEKEKNRELRYAVMAPDEWEYRRQVRDKFWQQFMAAKKQIVVDKAQYFSNS